MKALIVAFLLAASFIVPGDGQKQLCEENIQPDCFCTMIYDPVCGCNNKTYGNACVAECSGIMDYKPGECKTKKKDKNKNP